MSSGSLLHVRRCLMKNIGQQHGCRQKHTRKIGKMIDSASTVSPLRSSLEKPGVVSMQNVAWGISTGSPIQGDLLSSRSVQLCHV